jgi:FAD/FMN-containing dehydrogenase
LEKVTPDQVARFRDAADNLPGRHLAYELRQQLIDALDAAHAGHFQIGRTYAARTNVPEEAAASWRMLKRKYDPDGIMNPGVLGL